MSLDLTPYNQQASAARNQFAANMAANTFSRGLAQQRGSRQLGDLTRGFNRNYGGFAGGFGRRGLAGGGIQSGVQRNAMANYLGDYTRQYGDAQMNMQNELSQLDFNAARFEAERDTQLANIEAQKQAAIAQAALQIKALGPLFGG